MHCLVVEKMPIVFCLARLLPSLLLLPPILVVVSIVAAPELRFTGDEKMIRGCLTPERRFRATFLVEFHESFLGQVYLSWL